MNRPLSQPFLLKIIVNPARSLVDGDNLDTLQALLREHAPRWTCGLRIWRDRDEKTPVAITQPGSLAEAVRSAAVERGPLYRELTRRDLLGTPERVFGTAELRGTGRTLGLIVHIDEQVVRRSGDHWLWGNRIAIEVGAARVERMDTARWARNMLEALCGAMSTAYAQASMVDEFDAKNISRAGGGMRAIGLDVSAALPGLYWLNFLGRPYRDLIGRDRLLTAPAHEVREVDDGVLLGLAGNPRAWNAPECRRRERLVLGYLGTHYFFDRNYPDRKTVAPDFDLPTSLRLPGKG